LAGVYWMRAKDSGDVYVSEDGGELRSLRSWDRYCKHFNWASGDFFVHNLPYGKHTVTITVSDKKADESEGTAILIGAILVS